jgi:hypothetical protein
LPLAQPQCLVSQQPPGSKLRSQEEPVQTFRNKVDQVLAAIAVK